MRIRWTRIALADLVSARDHLAYENPLAVETMLRRVRDALQKLRRHPRIGRVVPERRSLGYREVVLPPCRLVYGIARGEIQLLRFCHARRDPSEM